MIDVRDGEENGDGVWYGILCPTRHSIGHFGDGGGGDCVTGDGMGTGMCSGGNGWRWIQNMRGWMGISGVGVRLKVGDKY